MIKLFKYLKDNENREIPNSAVYSHFVDLYYKDKTLIDDGYILNIIETITIHLNILLGKKLNNFVIKKPKEGVWFEDLYDDVYFRNLKPYFAYNEKYNKVYISRSDIYYKLSNHLHNEETEEELLFTIIKKYFIRYLNFDLNIVISVVNFENENLFEKK